MNFDFTDDQQAIKRTAKDLLAERFKMERVRELAEAGEYDDAVWNELCELGWPASSSTRSYGGQGLGIVELVILMEELGYALAPVPFLSNAAAGLVIQAAGSDEQKERWLPGIASGEQRGHGRAADATARPGSCRTLTTADVIVLCGAEGVRLVERSARRRRAGRPPWIRRAATRACARAAPARRSRASAGPGVGARCVAVSAASSPASRSARWRWPWSTRATASSSGGRSAPTRPSRTAARRCCSRSRARARPTYYGAWTADAEPETLALAASMAKAYASDAGWRVCASSLQVHGGIGFTWEHDLHFFLKRAKVDALLCGSARRAPRARRGHVERGRGGRLGSSRFASAPPRAATARRSARARPGAPS